MAEVLMWITLVLVAALVLVLAFYLIMVGTKLTRANKKLAELAGGLEAIEGQTRPLPQHLATINGALTELLGGLLSVNKHMAGISRVFKR